MKFENPANFRTILAMQDYNHQEIEKKWQKLWLKNKTFKAETPHPNPLLEGEGELKKKFYALDMFPYPSGAGLHVGHPLGMTATDIISRDFIFCNTYQNLFDISPS